MRSAAPGSGHARARRPCGRGDDVLVSQAAIHKAVLAFPGLAGVERPTEPGGCPGVVTVADTGPFARLRVAKRPPPADDQPVG